LRPPSTLTRSLTEELAGLEHSVHVLFARQVQESSAEIDPGFGGLDVCAVTDLFLVAVSEPDTTVVQERQRIGAIALATETLAEPVRAT
jgi:NTE family protein